ncbi:unnamed protein product [Linum tenue]|nr:unnamed protein product [Linum tenue]
MNPSIKSESNYFIAPQLGKKEVTWRKCVDHNSKPWTFYSVNDYFENGTCFEEIGKDEVKPNYDDEQSSQLPRPKPLKLNILSWSSKVL